MPSDARRYQPSIGMGCGSKQVSGVQTDIPGHLAEFAQVGRSHPVYRYIQRTGIASYHRQPVLVGHVVVLALLQHAGEQQIAAFIPDLDPAVGSGTQYDTCLAVWSAVA